MKVTTLIQATAVEVHDSLLFVLGGSPEWWWVSEIPTPFAVGVAIVVEQESVGESRGRVTVTVRNDEEAEVGRADLDIEFAERNDFAAGAPLLRPIAFSMPFQVTKVGAHRMTATNETGELLAEVRFGVRLGG